jgi:flagellin
MALAIATNNAALRAAASASSVNRDMETSMARLSSGKRINSASDDAAGVAISSRLTSNIRGTDQAIRNALDGQALIDTAEGAHKEIENILQRMREVAVQAANDTNNAQDRANLQAEMNALSEEINRIAGTTTWAGTKMLDAESSDFSFHIGAGVSEKDHIEVSIGAMTSSALGLGGSSSSSSSSSGSDNALATDDYPGKNNTDDITIENHGYGAAGVDSHIMFAGDTTGQSESIIEIQGIEYTITAGTIIEKTTDLQAQLASDGITVEDGGGSLYTFDGGALFSDYTSAFGRDPFDGIYGDGGSLLHTGFSLTGDPLNGNNDLGNNLSGRPELSASSSSSSSGPTLDSPSKAMAAITAIDNAIKTVNIQRSKLGAVSNRLSHTVNNLTNISSNLSAAQGGIEDADFAKETTDLAKNQILQQASTAMLAQANASKQNVLSLLQG